MCTKKRALGKELVDLVLRNARRSAAVVLGPDASDDILDHRLSGCVIGSSGGHDAIAVESCVGEDFGRIRRILGGDDHRLRFTEID